jgi:molybdopterin converting factor small subunit
MIIARFHVLLFRLVLPLCAALSSGCVTKGQAKAQAREAYLAGQREAMARIQELQAQWPSVRINGPVRNPVLPWTARLTLSQAIMAADYQGAGDPAEIIVVHNGVGRRVNVKDLLGGWDLSLQPGDVVQIMPPPPAPAMPGR